MLALYLGEFPSWPFVLVAALVAPSVSAPMIERTLRNVLFPPAVVIADERVMYRRRLQENLARQALRDLEAEAYLENNFFGMPYKSVAEELGMTEAEFLESMKRPP